MRCATCVRICYDRTAAAGWGVRAGASGDWAELTLFWDGRPPGGELAALVRAGRGALAAVHPALDLRGVSSAGAWLPPPAAVADAEAAVLAAWGAGPAREGPAGGGAARAESARDRERPLSPGPAEEKGAPPQGAPGSAHEGRPASPSWAAEEKGGPPKDTLAAPGGGPSARGSAEEKSPPPQDKSEVLGQSVLLAGRSRRRGGRNARKRTPVSLTDDELVAEICKIVKSHINLHGSAPNFADERSRPNAINFIRSTSGQQAVSAEILEAVRCRLAAGT